MRTSLILAALLCASGVVFAADAPQNKAATTQAQPLHRHPTLFGMLRRNNSVRRQVGLRAHRINSALTKAAQDQANYMAQTAQFSHYVNGGPQSRANKYGFRGGVLENIAYGTTSVDGAFAMWQGSPAHYASMVSGTTDAGFGYAIGPGGQTYWVSVYANVAPGDTPGWTEEEVANAIAAEAKRKAEEKNLAQAQKTDPNVQPASATEPAGNAAPTNPPGNNAPATGNAQPGNVQPGNAQPAGK